MSKARALGPIPPGEILRFEFMEPLGISQNQLARDLDVPVARISELVHGRRSISADTALRLEKYFGVEAQFWLNLQSRFDLQVERDRLGARLEREVAIFAAASWRGLLRSGYYEVWCCSGTGRAAVSYLLTNPS